MVGNSAQLGGVARDWRVDFFRGLALYMIIFDHIPGDPLGRFTYARLGFSDAAEIFVFLSGVSCGIVFSRVLLRDGLERFLKAVSRRSLQIYAYYLVASLVTILLIVVSRDVVTIPSNHQAFIALRDNPLAAIRSAIFLVSPPELPGILVLYLELTLIFIPAFLLIAARRRALALLLSGSLWLLAQIYPDMLPRLADHSYFNPLAWQFIFCIGMFVGTWYNSDRMSLAAFRSRAWVALASVVVGIGLFYRGALFLAAARHVNLDVLAVSDETLRHMKENLSALRLLHFLSVAFLVATFVKPTNPIVSWPGADAVINSGRCSLQVFCLGAILSVAFNLFVAVEGPGAFERLVLDGAAILLIAWAATALMRWRLDRRRLIGVHGGDAHGHTILSKRAL